MRKNMERIGNSLPKRLEINYYDKMDRLTEKDKAVKVVITEYDENDQEIRSLMCALSPQK
jgi:hypothetical protein